MNKYIPAEKLIAEIERLLKCTELHRGDAVADGSRQTLYWIKDFITSLQREQPPLPSNLDEAARECCKEEINGEIRYYPAIESYFKAGAKWQKEHDKRD